jgi:transcriptional regulator with XRE-family HTH domain
MPTKAVLYPQNAGSASIGAVAVDPELRKRVGAHIREARTRKGLSQTGLARLLPAPIDSGYVSRWERGENMPSWATLPTLAAALDVTVASLVSED